MLVTRISGTARERALRRVGGPASRGMLVAVALIVTACGGGGSAGSSPSSGSSPAPDAPSGLSYGTPPAFVLNQPITPLKPSVMGTVTSYSVSPTLPSGLSISGTTGVISGTPTVVTPKTTYTVTASNAGGSTTASLSIVVSSEGSAPSIAYTSPYYSFTVGAAAQVHGPNLSGGSITSWTVEPALPSGLALSQTDGSISGTPTATTAAAPYQVSALGSGGTATATLTLVVVPPLVDLGHAAAVSFMRLVGASLLTQDVSGHWVLWNYSSAQILASGNNPLVESSTDLDYVPPPVDLEGSIAVVQTATGLEVRAASDGHVLEEITATFSWWKLATDGSYLCAGNVTGLTVWSPAGTVLFTQTGNFSNAVAYAAPGQLELAQGPAGANVIETFAVPAGTSTVSSAYQGTFFAWFADGGRFITTLSSATAAAPFGSTRALRFSRTSRSSRRSSSSVAPATGTGRSERLASVARHRSMPWARVARRSRATRSATPGSSRLPQGRSVWPERLARVRRSPSSI